MRRTEAGANAENKPPVQAKGEDDAVGSRAGSEVVAREASELLPENEEESESDDRVVDVDAVVKKMREDGRERDKERSKRWHITVQPTLAEPALKVEHVKAPEQAQQKARKAVKWEQVKRANER
ncbi:hypothetical protein PInf_009982 [Phytophthora infestans]|nr:hypothetical protein PInf_009982 [Phytophthora infestans]